MAVRVGEAVPDQHVEAYVRSARRPSEFRKRGAGFIHFRTRTRGRSSSKGAPLLPTSLFFLERRRRPGGSPSSGLVSDPNPIHESFKDADAKMSRESGGGLFAASAVDGGGTAREAQRRTE
jgi:hypothetical protein